MKYVMFKGPSGKKVPIIFPDALSHIDVAIAVQAICPELEESKPVSAGFLSSLDIDATTSGKSTTLGLGSDPGDALVISTYDYTHGFI